MFNLLMEQNSLAIQNLDSLWFFANVLSSAIPILDSVTDENPITSEEQQNPKNQIQEENQNLSSIDPEIEVTLVPEHGIYVPVFEPEEVEISDAEKVKKKTKGRRSKRRSRKVFGELDLGFGENMDSYGSDLLMFGKKENENICYDDNYEMKMPPLSNGLAMKEHLKSWAYAVACTVR